MNSAANIPFAEVVTVCDIVEDRAKRAAGEVKKTTGKEPTMYFGDQHQPNKGNHKEEEYVCGDMNTSIIKTQLGRTIMIQHDVVSPRPYSRFNALCGSQATFFG